MRIADQVEIAVRRAGPTHRRAQAERVLEQERGTGVAPEVSDAALELLRVEPDLLERIYDSEQLSQELDALCPTLEGLASVSRTTLLAQLLWVLARVIDTKHSYTMGHSARVARAGFLIAQEFGDGISAWDVAWAGLLHDVGKLSVPRRLLDKPGRLTDAEWKVVKRHAADSQRIISTIRDLAHLAHPAASHHEQYAGGGYPTGASGERIPLIGRVLAYADVFDALTTTRAYRPALGPRDALTQTRAMVGTLLDPHLANVALAALEQLSAPNAESPSFEDFYKQDAADLDTGFGPEAGSSPKDRQCRCRLARARTVGPRGVGQRPACRRRGRSPAQSRGTRCRPFWRLARHRVSARTRVLGELRGIQERGHSLLLLADRGALRGRPTPRVGAGDGTVPVRPKPRSIDGPFGAVL